ncbi:MAG: fumarylacetoacetate hydrolase family protein [Rhodospirillaceae bacterium]|nr:fumarylacetoacetate hydrolase family protein [Rhodospirillaceae bacterium]
MKLGSRRAGRFDGELVVVSRDLRRVASAAEIAPTLQAALDDWDRVRPALEALSAKVNEGAVATEPFDSDRMLSPLPRAYQWCDGSVYWAHAERMAQWIGKPVPDSYRDEPWMYQGASDDFLAPTEDIPAASEDWGIDYEAEIAVVTTRVPYGADAATAARHIALVMLCNDVSLRNLIPSELAKGFGFVQAKPASAFSPVAVTPDELDTRWQDCRLHGPLLSFVNGVRFGEPDAGKMLHGFDRLIAHAAKTRALGAGTIVGGGTVADDDEARGTSCITERRVVEALRNGQPTTPYLHYGDRVRIEMLDERGASIFGAIEQKVARAAG